MFKRFAIAAFALATIALGTGCTSINIEPDEGGISYDAGPFASTSFQGCIPPGTRDWSGPFDEGYGYPNGQRTFSFNATEGAESPPIASTSKDGQVMTVSGGLTFYFTAADCKKLREFHEKIGKKFGAYDDDGWKKMLAFYVGNPVQRAMDEATLKYNWKELYQDAAKKALWEKEMATLSGVYVRQVAGADYFEKMAFIIRMPEPPKEIVDAMTATQTAVERNKAQQAENTRALTELDSLKELAKVLGPQGAILYKAIQRGDISVVPVPVGSNLNITSTPKK